MGTEGTWSWWFKTHGGSVDPQKSALVNSLPPAPCLICQQDYVPSLLLCWLPATSWPSFPLYYSLPSTIMWDCLQIASLPLKQSSSNMPVFDEIQGNFVADSRHQNYCNCFFLFFFKARIHQPIKFAWFESGMLAVWHRASQVLCSLQFLGVWTT